MYLINYDHKLLISISIFVGVGIRIGDNLNRNPINFGDVLCGSRGNAPETPQLLQAAVTESELTFVRQQQRQSFYLFGNPCKILQMKYTEINQTDKSICSQRLPMIHPEE
jgi:hypothetical protein